MRALLPLALVLVIAASCGSGDDQTSPDAASADVSAGSGDDQTSPDAASADVSPGADAQAFPDVVSVDIAPGAADGYRVSATISSPYDTPERYADAFRVIAPDGTVLGERILAHDHAAEQPFTRSVDGVQIPPGVTEITVEGRDLVNGWGGTTKTVAVP